LEPRLYQLKSTKPEKNPTPNGRANLPNIVTPGYVFRGKLRATVLKGYFMLFSIHPWVSIQRALMSIMIPENLLTRWKAYKKGDCNRCGLCCKIEFNCSFLADNTDGTYNCTIYQTSHAMSACRTFPINPKDLEEIQNKIAPYGQCGFYFEGAPADLTFGEVVKLYFRGIRDQISGKKAAEDRR